MSLFRIVQRDSSSRCVTSGRDAARHKPPRTRRLLIADEVLKLDHRLNVEDVLLKPDHRLIVDDPLSVDGPSNRDHPLIADALLNSNGRWRVAHLLRRNDRSVAGQQNDPNLRDLLDHQLRPNGRSVDEQRNAPNLRKRHQRNVRSVVDHQHNAAARLHVRPDRRRKRNA